MSVTTSSTKPMSVSMSKSASDASMHTVSLYFMNAFRKTMKDLNMSVENEAKALDLFAKHTNDAKDVLKGKILTVTKANNKKKGVRGVRTAYIFFCQDERAKIKEAQPALKNGQIMKILGSHWRSIKNTEEGKIYHEKNKQDKKRYEEECEAAPDMETNKTNMTKHKKKGRSVYHCWAHKYRAIYKAEGLSTTDVREKLKVEWAKFKSNPSSDEMKSFESEAQASRELAQKVIPDTVDYVCGDDVDINDILKIKSRFDKRVGAIVKPCKLVASRTVDV